MRKSCKSLWKSWNYEFQNIKSFKNEKINKIKVLIICHHIYNNEVCRADLSLWWHSLRYDRSWKNINDY